MLGRQLAAGELNLRSEHVTLIVHGVGGMQVRVETKQYLLKIQVKTVKGTLRSHGEFAIAEVYRLVPPKALQKIFPDVPLHELVRPKEIKLLISHKEGRLVPQRVHSVGDLVLWDCPLGKTVDGSHPELIEDIEITAHGSRTHFAHSMCAAAAACQEVTGKNPGPPPQPTEVITCTASRDFMDWLR